ncbi:hypothetical protein LINPERPRIM_LOCUS14438 [Linum perenne]
MKLFLLDLFTSERSRIQALIQSHPKNLELLQGILITQFFSRHRFCNPGPTLLFLKDCGELLVFS